MPAKYQDLPRVLEDFINAFQQKHGYSPSVREIGRGVGLSIASVSRCLSKMRDDGTIQYNGHRNIVTKLANALREDTICIPLLGTITCGLPVLDRENIEKYVRVPKTIVGDGEYFILRAVGDSMVEAGIDNGDIVLIRQQSSAEEGQIAVVLIDDRRATLKRVYPEPYNHRVRLHPENKNMSDIYIKDCNIQGIAVKVLKNLM